MGKLKNVFKKFIGILSKPFKFVSKKLKKFFSPVVGGHLDGYTFKKFSLSLKRMAPLLVNIGMLTVLLCTDKDTFDPVGWYYGATIIAL